MSLYVQATADTIIKYPFSRSDLLATFPNVSFPPNPSAEDLAPLGVYPVTVQPQPAHDSRTERLEPDEPVLADGSWQQSWSIRPATAEEIADYDQSHAPTPKWKEFGVALALRPEISQLYDQLPSAIASGLTVGLSQAAGGDWCLFVLLWRELTRDDMIPDGIMQSVLSAAEQHHLPSAFIEAISP